MTRSHRIRSGRGLSKGPDLVVHHGLLGQVRFRFYGPFREAADSAPAFGDRASYQHDPANASPARMELLEDIEEAQTF